MRNAKGRVCPTRTIRSKRFVVLDHIFYSITEKINSVNWCKRTSKTVLSSLSTIFDIRIASSSHFTFRNFFLNLSVSSFHARFLYWLVSGYQMDIRNLPGNVCISIYCICRFEKHTEEIIGLKNSYILVSINK